MEAHVECVHSPPLNNPGSRLFGRINKKLRNSKATARLSPRNRFLLFFHFSRSRLVSWSFSFRFDTFDVGKMIILRIQTCRVRWTNLLNKYLRFNARNIPISQIIIRNSGNEKEGEEEGKKQFFTNEKPATIKLSNVRASTSPDCGSVTPPTYRNAAPFAFATKRKLSRLKGEQRGGIPFAECNEKKKKKEKQGARNGTSATLDRYWRGEGEGKKGKKERNQFYAPLPYRFIRGGTKGVALFRAVFRWRRIDEIREWIQQQRMQRLLACAPLGRKSSRTGGTNGGTERKSMEIRVSTLETFPMEYPRIEFRFASHRSWIDGMEFIIVSELENNFPSKTRVCLVSLRNWVFIPIRDKGKCKKGKEKEIRGRRRARKSRNWRWKGRQNQTLLLNNKLIVFW